MNKVKWNKYEVAILIYGYYMFDMGIYTREFLIDEISMKLRDNTPDKKYKLDPHYRNHNGISMKFGNVQYLFTNGERGLKNKSKLESELFELFLNERNKFNQILDDAKKIYKIFLEC